MSALRDVAHGWQAGARACYHCVKSRDNGLELGDFLWALSSVLSRCFFMANTTALVPGLDMFNFHSSVNPAHKLTMGLSPDGLELSTQVSWSRGEEIFDFPSLNSVDDKQLLLNHGFLYGQPNTTVLEMQYDVAADPQWRQHCPDSADAELTNWKAEALQINRISGSYIFAVPAASDPKGEPLRYWRKTVDLGLPKELLFALRIQLMIRNEFPRAQRAFSWSPISLKNEYRVQKFLLAMLEELAGSYSEFTTEEGDTKALSSATALGWDVKMAFQIRLAEKRFLQHLIQSVTAMKTYINIEFSDTQRVDY